MMNPQIDNIFLDNDTLQFTLLNINLTIANTLRRTILSDIQTVVFKTYPYKECDATIEENTTRLNNEILKQRLSCIPIHITDPDFPIENFILVVDKENTSNIIEYVTTEDFKLYDINTKTYMPINESQIIFPMNKQTKQYIDFVRIRPKISEEIPGEKLKLTCKLSKHTAKEDQMFNVACNSSYGYSIDKSKVDEIWNNKEVELKKQDILNDELEYIKNDFYNLDAKRIFITNEKNEPNSFDFTVQTVGVFTPYEIVKKSCSIIINNLEEFKTNKEKYLINKSDNTIKNSFDIILYHTDHTFGKCMEYLLYNKLFINEQKLAYCGFQKKHPHDDYTIIRLAYNEEVEREHIIKDINTVCDTGIELFKDIDQLFIE